MVGIVFGIIIIIAGVVVLALKVPAGIGIPISLVWLFLWVFKFTIVKESTAKITVRLGGFKDVLIAWEDHDLDSDWNVIDKKGKKWAFGGLRFVGIRWIDSIYTYKFRWRDIQLTTGKEEAVEFHEQKLDYIFVRPDVYMTEIKGAETLPPERIPLDIQFLITMQVINPYRALFKAPSNWNENLLARLNALFRDWVATQKYDELLAIQNDKEGLWKRFQKFPLIEKECEEWGIEIIENGIQMRTITPPEEIRKAGAREKQMAMETLGRVKETAQLLLEARATAQGKTVNEIQKVLDSDPEKLKEFLEESRDLIIRKMGIDKNAYVDIRVQGASGLEQSLLNIVSAWKRMPSGDSIQAQGEEKEKVKIKERDEKFEEGPKKKLTKEEIKQAYKEVGDNLKKRLEKS